MGCDSQYDLTVTEQRSQDYRDQMSSRGYYSVRAVTDGLYVHRACGAVIGDADAHETRCPAPIDAASLSDTRQEQQV